LGLLDLDGDFLELGDLAGDYLCLSLLSLLEFLLNLLQGEWVGFFPLFEALPDRWVGSEVLVEWKVKTDWLWCCLVGLHDVM